VETKANRRVLAFREQIAWEIAEKAPVHQMQWTYGKKAEKHWD
jgi:hypothetical protein